MIIFTSKNAYDIIFVELERGVTISMNQILQTELNKNKGPIEIKKIIIFFAIAIAIFAIILIGLGIYKIVSNNQNDYTDESQQTEEVPNVEITKQDDNTVLIEITGNIAITKIVYNWNDEESQTIDTQNNTTVSETIDLPFGTNTLNLTVVDTNGKETKYQKEYVVDGDGKPVIQLKLTIDYKIKITVQDAASLKNISYAWNNDDATLVEADQEDASIIEETVEIPLGQNTLKVTATNINDVTVTKELEVKGVTRPTLSFQKDGDYLIIKAEDETGLKVVDYTLNGQKYQLNYGNKTVIEYRQAIEKGESYMEITAENQEGATTTKKVRIIN